MKDKTLISLIIILVVLSLSVGYSIRDISDKKKSEVIMSYEIMQPLDVKGEVYSLWEDLMEFYNYNITNKNKDLTLEELKLDGGVCWHYANWYVEEANKKGLLAKRIDFYGEEKGHAITVIYDKQMSEYCIVSNGVRPYCSKLGVLNEE